MIKDIRNQELQKFLKLTLVLVLLIVLPVFKIINNNTGAYVYYETLLVGFSLVMLLLGIYSILSNVNVVLAKIVVILLLYNMFFIRLILSFVYDFSGRGFTSEFFAHFSWESFKIGLVDYGIVFTIAIVVLVLFTVYLYNFLSRIQVFNKVKTLSLITVGLFVLFVFKNQAPEWRLFKAYNRYFSISTDSQIDKLTIRASTKETLTALRYDADLPKEKKDIKAKIGDKPKNVIIIYLESFSEVLTENRVYPNLTPNLDQLKKDYISFENNFSSGYVTIEGIANSQCGTLMDMDSGNNSLTTEAGRLPSLPCLGDILNVAGYTQTFFGGADLAFAGKGAFLQEHGYDELRGRAYWTEKAIGQQNQWGLTDSDLFNFSLERIKELDSQPQPFNFTLLTLGTHIPGFSYEGCQPYVDSKIKDTFLDAIHCTDYLLGEFIQQLKDVGVLDNTIIYIQGDHAIFPTHDMKELFGEDSIDKRVLTLIIDKSKAKNSVDQNYPTSTYNLVANILDLLEIDHNVDFIFSHSDFSTNNKHNTPYIMTRYNDYYEGDSLYNINRNIDCLTHKYITLPLDSCDKQKALEAVYQLDSSYNEQILDTQVCILGADFIQNYQNNTIKIKWGNLDASHLFYYQGRLLKTTKEGFYVLKLNERDDVTSQVFYSVDNRNELKKLIRYLSSKKARFVLLNNLLVEAAQPRKNNDLLEQMPKIILENNFIYAQNINSEIVSFSEEKIQLGRVNFFPESCQSGFSINDIDISEKTQKEPFNFCPITKWGPKNTVFLEKFNQQSNGQSAFWVVTDCGTENTVIRFNNIRLDTTVRIPTITALIDDETLINQPGTYTLELYDTLSGATKKIGDFKVMPNKNSRIKSPR